jgi:hypothetical protein
MIVPYRKRITGNSTTTIVTTPCYVQQIVISCAVPGATWTLKIQDQASPSPFVLIPEFTLSVPPDGYTNVMWGGVNFYPIPMEGGIDIVTAAGTGTREVIVIAHIVQQQ